LTTSDNNRNVFARVSNPEAVNPLINGVPIKRPKIAGTAKIMPIAASIGTSDFILLHPPPHLYIEYYIMIFLYLL